MSTSPSEPRQPETPTFLTTLSDEHQRVISYVVAHLSPERAGRLMEAMDEAAANERRGLASPGVALEGDENELFEYEAELDDPDFQETVDNLAEQKRGLVADTTYWTHGEERPPRLFWYASGKGAHVCSDPDEANRSRVSDAAITRADLHYYLCRVAPDAEARAHFQALAVADPDLAGQLLDSGRIEGEPARNKRDLAPLLSTLDLGPLMASSEARTRLNALSVLGRVRQHAQAEAPAAEYATARTPQVMEPPKRGGMRH